MNENISSIELENYNTHVFSLKIYLAVKRFFDIVFALIGCLFILPIAVIIKIAYLLTGDKESIFFSQDRVGRDGKTFKFYKFRTMIPDADKVLQELMENDLEITREYTINKKLENDPRVTKVGKFLRNYSIDELPQLLNILKGDMSLIGNRPYLVREIKDMGDYYNDIVKTKPGLTGYWQVSGRNDVTFKKRLKLESYYSNNLSLHLDVKIFFKTFVVVLLKKGSK